jgi:phosphotransferase system HPr-like phosphotransfer protein
LEILLLDAGPGSSLEIRAEGIEEEIAIRRILGLF